jgi:putative phosphoserine phosphatase/1-acylglycerol-3-phosphate O-acyltransferase
VVSAVIRRYRGAMTRGAAFFDLDRTLLRGASGPVLQEHLKAAGLVGDRTLPGQGMFNRVYDVLGENRLFMAASKQLVRVAKGWDVLGVQEAAAKAAQQLVDLVQPYAIPIIKEHHDAGRLVVLATTTPYELVKPFADALGFDDVIATRYGVENGRFDGTFVDGFVWGKGKLASVREWAAGNGVDLAESFAYSDSYFDSPLLGAVGNPFAVNPDVRLQALATVRRWPIIHLDAPNGVPKLLGIEPQMIVQQFFRSELIRYARFDIDGVNNVPARGPAILALNHRSYFDVVAAGAALVKRGRPVRVLAKKELFEVPVLGPVFRALGTIRVDRGSGSDEPLRDAAKALEGGELVALFPQGTIPRGEAFFETELQGRHGVARLATQTRVPVIPIGMWGTEKVWPRSAKVPNALNLFNPPLVTVRVGQPVELQYADLDSDTRRIMAAIREMLPPEAQVARTPTDEELARSYPSGRIPDDSSSD